MGSKIVSWLLGLVLLVSLMLSGYSARAQATNNPLFQTVIIILKEQPQVMVAEQVWDEKQPQLERIHNEIRTLDPLAKELSQAPQPLTREQEDQLVKQFAFQKMDSRTLLALQQKAEEIDNLRQQARQEILQRSQVARDASQKELIQRVEKLGGQILYRYQSVNALAVRIPASQRSAIENLPGVQEVLDDQVMEALLDHSTPSIGAPFFWNSGFTGAGVDVAILDTGIDANHPALSGKVLAQKRCLAALDQYQNTAYTDPTADDVNGHGTHVGGIVASQDNTYRGVAFGVRSLINAKAGGSTDGVPHDQYAYMEDADALACVDWAISGNAYGADVINLSFGSRAYSDDSAYLRFWDSVVSQMNVLVSIAAGNDGPYSNTLYSPSTAYNVLSVANIDDKNTSNVSSPSEYYSSRKDDIIRDSSSRGPTVGNRKKPDVAAPGTAIVSTNNTWDALGGSLFISYTGTSMAAPHVAGAAALVMSRGVANSMAVKALLINTAQDLGSPGWDNAYGWGYIDLYNLNAHVNDYFLDSVNAAPAFKLYAGPALNGDAATLVWNRRANYVPSQYPTTVYPLTNLDLYAYDESNNNLLASSTSTIDNVEQVRFSSDISSVVLKVKDMSPTLAGVSSEPYALATQEGFIPRYGPMLQPIALREGDIRGLAGTTITLTVQIKNSGDLMAFGNNLTLTVSSGLMQINSEPLTASLPDLGVDLMEPQVHQWVFQKIDDQPQSILLITQSQSYGETFSFFYAWYPFIQYFPLIEK